MYMHLHTSLLHFQDTQPGFFAITKDLANCRTVLQYEVLSLSFFLAKCSPLILHWWRHMDNEAILTARVDPAMCVSSYIHIWEIYYFVHFCFLIQCTSDRHKKCRMKFRCWEVEEKPEIKAFQDIAILQCCNSSGAKQELDFTPKPLVALKNHIFTTEEAGWTLT